MWEKEQKYIEGNCCLEIYGVNLYINTGKGKGKGKANPCTGLDRP